VDEELLLRNLPRFQKECEAILFRKIQKTTNKKEHYRQNLIQNCQVHHRDRATT
jgi:hypothetical protein